MTLTSEYQYIGRSNAVTCPAGWSYYILLYAKTLGDTATGHHSVTVKQRLVCNANSTFYGWNTSGSVTVAGASAISWTRGIIPSVDWEGSLTEGGETYARYVDLKEGTVQVNTGYGAAKDVTIESSWVMNDTNSAGWFPASGVYANASITVTLPMIAGASEITAAAEVILGYACNVKWIPKAATLRYRLRFSMGDWSCWSGIIAPNQTTEYTYTGCILALDAANQIPDSPTGTMTAALYTYTDSSATVQVGAADTEAFQVRVPENENTKPTVSITALTPVNSLGTPFNGMFIQGKGKIKGSFSGSGRYGAEITAYTMSMEGRSYGSAEGYTSDYISGYGDITVKVTAKDSRGFTSEAAAAVYAAAYAKPKVSVSLCARCDSGGTAEDAGTYLRIVAARTYNKVDTGSGQTNFCAIRYRYKTEGGNYGAWTELLPGSSMAADEVDSGPILGTLAVDTTYVVQVGVIDTLGGTSEAAYTVLSEAVFMHERAGGNGLGLGKYCEEDNLLDVAWNLRVRGAGYLSSINGAYLLTRYVGGTNKLRLQTKYSGFTGTGDNRQSIFLFGSANFAPVCGLLMVSNAGSLSWSGTGTVSAAAGENGTVELTLPNPSWDWFTLLSAEYIAAA